MQYSYLQYSQTIIGYDFYSDLLQTNVSINVDNNVKEIALHEYFYTISLLVSITAKEYKWLVYK